MSIREFPSDSLLAIIWLVAPVFYCHDFPLWWTGIFSYEPKQTLSEDAFVRSFATTTRKVNNTARHSLVQEHNPPWAQRGSRPEKVGRSQTNASGKGWEVKNRMDKWDQTAGPLYCKELSVFTIFVTSLAEKQYTRSEASRMGHLNSIIIKPVPIEKETTWVRRL